MRKPIVGLIFVIAAALGACASAPSTTADTEGQAATLPNNQAVIEVQNNRPGMSDIRVYIEPVGGIRAYVGAVDYSKTGQFPYVAQTGEFVLAAETATGTTFRSERFNLRNGQIARWNMSINRVLVGAR
jgi:FlaG/FlaF family flagellin (archaellin)